MQGFHINLEKKHINILELESCLEGIRFTKEWTDCRRLVVTWDSKAFTGWIERTMKVQWQAKVMLIHIKKHLSVFIMEYSPCLKGAKLGCRLV